MTTEDDFHKLLDQNPHDHHTRLVFADWLQDRGDPRAAGYRALGKLGVTPFKDAHRKTMAWTHADNRHPANGVTGSVVNEEYPVGSRHGIATDWFRKMTGGPNPRWRDFDSRKEAEDAAALAFGKLSPERQAELLGTHERLQRKARLSRRRISQSRSSP